MGLDTTHDCWHGPYGAFSEFRTEVAEAARKVSGYVPRLMGRPIRCYYGWWDNDHPYDHVLDVFFVHSDCEGYIFPKDAEPLAKALDDLVEHLPHDDQWSARERLQQFIRGLRRAADEYQIVEFH